MQRLFLGLLIVTGVVAAGFALLGASGIAPFSAGDIGVFYLLLSGLFAVLVVMLLIVGLVKLVQLPANRVFGENMPLRLISLGIAALLFSDVVINVFGDLITFALSLMRGIPDQLYMGWQQAATLCGDSLSYTFSTCLGNTGFIFARAWAGAISDAYRESTIALWQYDQLVFFFAAWVLFGQLLSLLTPNQAQGDVRDVGRRVQQFMTPARQKNLLFFAFLALGGYFSITAIIALPILQETSPNLTQVSADSFRQQLETLRRDTTLPTFDDNESPFQSLETYLSDAASAQNADTTNGTPVTTIDPRIVQLSLRNQQRQRSELLVAYRNLINDAQGSLDDSMTLATQAYELNSLNRRGDRESVAYYMALMNWYLNSTRQTEDAVSNCIQQMQKMDTNWRLWSQSIRQVLMRNIPVAYSDEWLADAYSSVRATCNQLPRLQVIPDRPSLGSFSGAFGVVAGWLLDSESVSLALIVGLVGFGLLGALSSTAIREQAVPGQPRPAVLVDDLTGVLLRGVSAAVIVFMAGKGGLAVFASEGSELNPYVLLLVCLAAAVFSEVIWEWARGQLEGYFGPRKPQPSVEETPLPPGDETMPELQPALADGTAPLLPEAVPPSSGTAGTIDPDTGWRPINPNG